MADSHQVVCSECKSGVVLERRPTDGLYLVCECGGRSVNVDEAVSDSALFEPFSGHWSASELDQPFRHDLGPDS